MEKMRIFVPDDGDRTSTVEAKVYRHIAEVFTNALRFDALPRFAKETGTVQDYRELTSHATVLEHFRVLGAEKVYKGTVAEWRCDIEAPEAIIKRLKTAQEVLG